MASNADLARRWYRDVWAAGGEATVQELMSDGIVGFMEGADVRSRDQFLAVRAQMFQAFPDMAIVVEDVIEEGSKVAVRWHVNATHSGDGLGMPATGRAVAIRGITWLEFEGGLLVRGWDSWNLGGMLESLRPA